MTESAGGTDTTIDVVLPARTEMASTLRVLVASLGADVGFTLDEIDDVRLAVSEVFASAADTDGIDRFAIAFQPGPGQLTIAMSAVGDADVTLDELATTIMKSVVDEVAQTPGCVTITKRADEAVR